MEILAIITARKGSKRLPNKNTKLLKGIPLIEHTIENCLDSKYIDDVIVTSDDNMVKQSVNKYRGSPVINIRFHRRPKHLRGDNVTSQEVIDDVISRYKYNKYEDTYQAYVLLQPTSPLRTAEHIDKCIETYLTGLYDSVITVSKLRHSYVYVPNGAVYVFREKIYAENMGLVIMKEEESIDIDTESDFRLAEMMLNDDNS